MTKVLVECELLKEIASNNDAAYAIGHLQQRLHDVLARPAHDVEASVPVEMIADWNARPYESCGTVKMCLIMLDFGLSFALCNMDHAGTRRDIKKAQMVLEELRRLLADPAAPPAHMASVPTFPCESCGAFHSYSEVSEAGGYCPRCEADYDERKMLADLLERYTTLAAAPQPFAQEVK